MKKKIALMLCAAVTAASVMGGCGSSSSTSTATSDAAEETEADAEETEEAEAEADAEEADTEEAEAASATDYPTGQINLIIPQDVGGGSDLIARVLAAQVEADLGVSVVCTNLTGGSTSIGMQEVADSEPDGYTIGMSMTNLATMAPLGYSELTPDDFEAICAANYDAASILIRTDDERFSDLEGLVAYAKEHPGELNWGTGGAGGMWHMAILKFCNIAGIEVNVVPDAGGGTGVGLALANGDIDAAVFSPVDCMSQIESGQITPIVSMTDERMASFQDTPTAIELGYDIEVYSTRGFVAPKGTPAEVIDVLEASFKKAVESEEFADFIESQSSNIRWLDSEEYTEWLQDEIATYVPILEDAGLVAN